MEKFKEFELDLVNEGYSKKSTHTCLSASSILFTVRCTVKCNNGGSNPTTKGCKTVNTCRTMR